MSRTSLSLAYLATLLLLLSLAGCAPRGIQPVKAFSDLPPAEQEVDSDAGFLYELAKKPHCSTDDAYRGMLYFIDGTDTAGNFQERTARLAMHGVIKKSWTHNPNSVATKGTVAYMLARAVGIKGGLMYNITGACPRYALRELAYQGIIVGTSEYDQISGTEYIGILGRADDYRQTREN